MYLVFVFSLLVLCTVPPEVSIMLSSIEELAACSNSDLNIIYQKSSFENGYVNVININHL